MGILQEYSWVIGIDEVGRGSLAGPMYIGGVALNNAFPIYTHHHKASQDFTLYPKLIHVRDSKQLTEKQRSELAHIIQAHEITYQLLSLPNTLIDNFGLGACLNHGIIVLIACLYQGNHPVQLILDGKIRLATRVNQALIQAILDENAITINTFHSLYPPANHSSSNFDGHQEITHPNNLYVYSEPKADDTYLSVAMASILAKVARDSYMSTIHNNHPEFGWRDNKGYGTKAHRQAIISMPENPFLRQSFLGNIRAGL